LADFSRIPSDPQARPNDQALPQSLGRCRDSIGVERYLFHPIPTTPSCGYAYHWFREVSAGRSDAIPGV